MSAVNNSVKQCQLCSFQTTSMTFYLKHLTLLHKGPGFFIQCRLNGCIRTYHNVGTYKNHVYAFHSNSHQTVDVVTSNIDDRSEDDDDHNGDNNEGNTDIGNDESALFTPSILKRSAAKWILKFKEKYKIPNCVVDGVIQDTRDLFKANGTSSKLLIASELRSKGVDESVIAVVERVICEQTDVFDGLDSNYLQTKYFRDHFNLLEPETIVLGTQRKMRGTGSKRKCVEVKHEMKYMPILMTLQRLLQDTNVLNEIEHGHSSVDGVIRDYCDGKIFKNHPLTIASMSKKWLQICIYYDDLEVCNPLGSKRTIHKIGAFYFTLGNISPKKRSKIHAIQLLSLVKVSVIKMYGINSILKPIVDDIKKLEAGYEFILGGKKKLFYGSICVLSADNPASNSCGGFKESASAKKPCRHCMIDHADLSHKVKESQVTLRNPSDHRKQICEIEAPGGHDAGKAYGLNRRSILDELEYFKVSSGTLVPDILHDILEGALQYQTKLMLREFICHDQYFSLEQLNHKIESYDLGYLETKNRPTPIAYNTFSMSNDYSLKQSASQMWCLGRFLPLMIGDWVPHGNEHWTQYTLMLGILDILFSPELQPEDIAMLSIMIENHHREFPILYPNASFIPKMHYMIHMPRLIRLYGPLKNHWTMRYESKHSYFKQLASSLKNFINICHTLITRHEQYQCYLMLENSLFKKDFEEGPSLDHLRLDDDGHELEYRVKWVKINGIKYNTSSVLVIGYQDDLPVFGKVSNIYINTSGVRFFVSVLAVHLFDPHYHAYVVSMTTEHLSCTYDQLQSFYPLTLNFIQSRLLVVLKFHITIPFTN